MSLKNTFEQQERSPEKFPSQEEIKATFETILKGREYKELGIKSNEEGVFFYEIEVLLEDGEKIEYNFQKATYDYRDTSLPASAQFSASIHETIYDADGRPVSGKCVANYLDEKWEYSD